MNAPKRMNEEVASPCVNVCVMDEGTGLCRGCLRTLDEIAGWGSLPDTGKRAVLVKVAARRQSLGDSLLVRK